MDGKSLERWIGLVTLALLLAGQLTTNLPVAAESVPVAPVANAPDGGRSPVLPGEKSPAESVGADIGLVCAAPPAKHDVWAAEVIPTSLAWSFAPSLQQAHTRLQI